MGYFRANISIYVTSESHTQQQEENNCFLITGLGNFKTIYQSQRTAAMSSFVEPYFDDIFCGICYSCEVKKIPENYLDLVLSASRKSHKNKSFSQMLPLEQPYPPQKGRILDIDPDFNKRIIINYSCMQSMMHK